MNWRGRTVRRAREEATLHDALENHLEANAPRWRILRRNEIHQTIAAVRQAEKAAGRLTLSTEEPTPFGWWIMNLLHLVGMPLLFLLALPLPRDRLPVLSLRLRRLEKTDPELCARVDQAYSDGLAEAEDHDVTNQFTAMGSLKPGLVRL